MTDLLEMPAHFGVIINFAVEDQDGVARDHRLRAMIEVDNFQPHGAERDLIGFPDALLIGSTMGNGSGDRSHAAGLSRAARMGETGDAAHYCSSCSGKTAYPLGGG